MVNASNVVIFAQNDSFGKIVAIDTHLKVHYVYEY